MGEVQEKRGFIPQAGVLHPIDPVSQWTVPEKKKHGGGGGGWGKTFFENSLNFSKLNIARFIKLRTKTGKPAIQFLHHT